MPECTIGNTIIAGSVKGAGNNASPMVFLRAGNEILYILIIF